MVDFFGLGKRAIGFESQESKRKRFLELQRIKEKESNKLFEGTNLTKEEKKNILLGKQIELQKKQKSISRARQTGYGFGKSVGAFGQAPPQEDFSFQEQVLRETVGGRGEHIWGTNMQPVEINNDLNPRQSGRPGTGETAEMFGFGGR